MTEATGKGHPIPARKAKRPVMPTSALGKWGLALTLLGFASFIVLPMITVNFRDTYPITDSWIMPAIGVAIIDAGAVLNVLALWRAKDESLLTILAMALGGAFAAFATAMFVGEGIGSWLGITE